MDKDKDKGMQQSNKTVLLHSEKHFRGYWVQLQSRIRRNDDADEVIEGYLENPLSKLREAWDEHKDNPRPAGDQISDLYNTGDSVDELFNFCVCIKTLYAGTYYGDPAGNFPPTKTQLEMDPLRHIRDFSLATSKGTKGGRNLLGRSDAATRAWLRSAIKDVDRYRKACKYIWDTALATLPSEKATTIIAGLPYGSGPTLLKQIKNQQQRQTTMALFTLFSQLITLQLRPGEGFASLNARALGIRERLANWNPPIKLPDQLLIVCLLRLLPSMFHGSRTIIMSTPNIDINTARDMLLDVENRDAERIATELGAKAQAPPPPATGLLGDGIPPPPPPKLTKKKKKRKKNVEKSAKYHSEGPCSVHGSRCSHASSECYVLHPELKPKKGGEADIAQPAAVAQPLATADLTSEGKPFGFMNEIGGFAFMMSEDEKHDIDDELEVSSVQQEDTTYVPEAVAHALPTAHMVPTAHIVPTARPVPTGKKAKYYAVAVGHRVGIYHDDSKARKAYEGYSNPKHKSFKNLSDAEKYIAENREPTASYNKSKTKKRPKNYGWSKRGTKSSRKQSRSFGGKNVVVGEVIQAKRKKGVATKGIKQLGRKGGSVEYTEATIDLCQEQEPDANTKLMSSVLSPPEQVSEVKDLTRVQEEAASALHELMCRKVEERPQDGATASSNNRRNSISVKTRRVNRAGTVTTMVHPNEISRYAVDMTGEEVPAEKKVTLELEIEMATLKRLKPGSKIKLQVESIEGPSGEALISFPEQLNDADPYNFMYDADNEGESEDEEGVIECNHFEEGKPNTIVRPELQCSHDSDDSLPTMVSVSDSSDDSDDALPVMVSERVRYRRRLR